jgi:hypothetical protein
MLKIQRLCPAESLDEAEASRSNNGAADRNYSTKNTGYAKFSDETENFVEIGENFDESLENTPIETRSSKDSSCEEGEEDTQEADPLTGLRAYNSENLEAVVSLKENKKNLLKYDEEKGLYYVKSKDLASSYEEAISKFYSREDLSEYGKKMLKTEIIELNNKLRSEDSSISNSTYYLPAEVKISNYATAFQSEELESKCSLNASADEILEAYGLDKSLGEKLAESSEKVGNSGLSAHTCLQGVYSALDGIGVDLSGFQKASQAIGKGGLQTMTNKFTEITAEFPDATYFDNLPEGAIVVWESRAPGEGGAGHISIAIGDGQESSWEVREQTTRLYGAHYRVFYPNNSDN